MLAVAGDVGRPRHRLDALLAERGKDPTSIGGFCGSAASARSLPNEAWSTALAWASCVGWSSAPTPGCTAFATCGSDGRGVPPSRDLPDHPPKRPTPCY